MLETYVSREEAADFLGVSTRTLDRYVRKKILKPHRRGRRTLFLRLDVESLSDVPEPKSHVVAEQKENFLPEKPDPDIAALANLAQEMHRELQKKDQEISQLNFQLGKYQEIAKNSVPLLEARKQEQQQGAALDTMKKKLSSAQKGRMVFFGLFTICLGVIGILVHYLFLM
jgi:excisionase family DNA binding protein